MIHTYQESSVSSDWLRAVRQAAHPMYLIRKETRVATHYSIIQSNTDVCDALFQIMKL
jgi:hypothetical protein